MGKNKLARWNELDTFMNVIQTGTGKVSRSDHPVRGRWREQIFRNDNPIVLELGCGRGEYTVALAERYPDTNFIGIDIKGARLWRGAKTSNERKLSNAAFLRTRIEFLASYFGEDEADEIWITFPDPHPGLRHAGRRLSSPPFLNLYRTILNDKGLIHLKTDNEELHRYSLHVAEFNSCEITTALADISEPGAVDNPVLEELLSIRTHYENIWLAKGMKITYLCFRLEKDKTIQDPYSRKDTRG
ncbi:MAG: tRNA (guanosine(46)-N7)-methyltransferase TrmB [Bacteroidales bacterium]|nr:tRNA (guanosine(46)-N7)-methyltransferase TrmB [Bacteroidales bacterium]